MYPQGNREKYWFAYRKKRFDEILDCEKKYSVFVCRDKKVTILKIPTTFIEKNIDKLNYSTNENNEITHYHIHFFKDGERMSILFSKPVLQEVEITKYVIYSK